MNPKDEEVKVEVDWRPTAGEPSATWRKLVRILLAARKTTPPAPRETAKDERCENGERRDLQN